MSSMVTIVNNIVLYIWKLLRVDLKSSHKKIVKYVWWGMLTKIIVVMILQHKHIANHAVHQKLIQCYISFISILKKEYHAPC